MSLLGNALKRSEERFRTITQKESEGKLTSSIVENAPDLIMLVNKDGKVLFSNRKDQRETSVLDQVPENDRDAIQECISDVILTGGERTHESWGKGSSGEDRWYRWHIAPDKSKDPVEDAVIITTDITEYKGVLDEFEKIKQELEDLAKEKANPLERVNSEGERGTTSETKESIEPVISLGELEELKHKHSMEINELKKKMEKGMEQLKMVEQELTALRQNRDELIKARSDRSQSCDDESESLKQECSRLKEEVKRLEESIENIVKERTKELDELNIRLTTENTEIKNAAQESLQIIEELSANIEQINSEMETVNQRTGDESKQVKNVQEENNRTIEELNQKIKDLHAQLEAANLQAEDESEKIESIQEENNRVIEELNLRIQELSMELETANKRAEDDSAKVKLIREENEKAMEELSQRCQVLSAELEETNKRAHEESSQLKQIEQESDNTIEELTQRTEDLSEELEGANQKVERLFKELKDKERDASKEIDQLNIRIDELSVELKIANQKLEQEKEQALSFAKISRTSIQELRRQMDGLRGEIDGANAKLQEEETRYCELNEEFSKYRKEVQESEDMRIRKMEGEKEQLEHRIRVLESMESDLTRYKEETKGQMDECLARSRYENQRLQIRMADLEWSEEQFLEALKEAQSDCEKNLSSSEEVNTQLSNNYKEMESIVSQFEQYREEMELKLEQKEKHIQMVTEQLQVERANKAEVEVETKCSCEKTKCLNKRENENPELTEDHLQDELDMFKNSLDLMSSHLGKFEFLTSLLTNDAENLDKTITNNLQMLLIGIYGEMNDNQRGVIERVISQSKEMADMIGKAKKIAESEKGAAPRSIVDIIERLEAGKENIKELHKNEEIEFNIDLDEEARFVLANGYLDDVFHHLFANSIRYNVESPKKIWIRSKGTRNGLKLIFEDNGTGLSGEHKKRVNGNYSWSIKGAKSSLGLYIIKSVVEGIDGKVHVEDRVNGNPELGSKFVLEIPTPQIIDGIIPNEQSSEGRHLEFHRIIRREEGMLQECTQISNVFISDSKIDCIDEPTMSQSFGEKLSKFLSLIKSLTLPIGDYKFDGRQVVPS